LEGNNKERRKRKIDLREEITQNRKYKRIKRQKEGSGTKIAQIKGRNINDEIKK
jgi:hypothetical protein